MRLARPARQWGQLAAQVLLLVVLAGLVQVLADRSNHRIDLTATRSLTLAPVTEQVLRELTEPLRITVFYDRGHRGEYAALLKRMAAVTPEIEPALYDLDRYPERARSMGVTAYGRAALEYAGRRTVALALPEEQLLGGILKVVRGRPRRLAWVVGHGERAPAGGKESYQRLLSALEHENYAIEPLPLDERDVPPDTDVVVVAGPQRGLSEAAVARLAAHLAAGGSVLLLLDPGPLPGLEEFLASLGIRLGRDVVVDRERQVLATDGLAAVVEFFRQGNPITASVASPIEAGVVLPSARSVEAGEARPGVTVEPIARTGESAWAMADLDRARRGEEPTAAAHDRPGPIAVMAMAEVATDGPRVGRLVVVGDADFASDAYFDMLGNANLAQNAIAWLAREDALAGARPVDVPEVPRPLSPLVLTRDQARRLFLSIVVLQPLFVLALGVGVVGLRRRRG